jgi:hypothetical protein
MSNYGGRPGQTEEGTYAASMLEETRGIGGCRMEMERRERGKRGGVGMGYRVGVCYGQRRQRNIET